MTYKMNQEQFESVLVLSGEKRYEHFIGKALDFEEVWSLRNEEGFVSMSDDYGNNCIPFWPHEDYARALATDSWSDCLPESIKLEDFIEKWLPGLDRDGLKISVFPTPKLKGIIAEPGRVKQDLEIEIEQDD